MHIGLLAGGALLVFLLAWLLLRSTVDNTGEKTTTVLSSDLYTKVVITIIAIATSIMAIQGLVN